MPTPPSASEPPNVCKPSPLKLVLGAPVPASSARTNASLIPPPPYHQIGSRSETIPPPVVFGALCTELGRPNALIGELLVLFWLPLTFAVELIGAGGPLLLGLDAGVTPPPVAVPDTFCG